MFTSVLQNRCPKSIRKFYGETPSLCSSMFSTYFLGQTSFLCKAIIFMEPYHKRNFQVMTLYSPTHFFMEAIVNYQTFLLLTKGLFRHVMESIHKICCRTPYPAVLFWGLINSEEGTESFQISQKERLCQFFIKTKYTWGNLTMHHRTPSPRQSPLIKIFLRSSVLSRGKYS